MDLFSKDFIKGYFTRNKKLLLISLAIFLIAFLLGAIVSFIKTGSNHGIVSSGLLSGQIRIPLNEMLMDGWLLFLHNFTVDLATLILGVLFSVISVILFVFNAFSIGMPFGEDFLFAFFTIVPHSIIEYSASLFALVGAFLITSIEIDIIKSFRDKDKSVGEVIAESNVKLKDILLSAIIMMLLLAIAAVIESQITPRIVVWFFGG